MREARKKNGHNFVRRASEKEKADSALYMRCRSEERKVESARYVRRASEEKKGDSALYMRCRSEARNAAVHIK